MRGEAASTATRSGTGRNETELGESVAGRQIERAAPQSGDTSNALKVPSPHEWPCICKGLAEFTICYKIFTIINTAVNIR
jgi:hypothetical protein